ncbi:hypothetical protein PAESOLCIP111_03941 [Paenibacillus solanacearum]|uniref:Uncharacterized protein n=1 Tax=Paenibacillus solanacearum TaxID=2048548 RepID=A0A916K3E9_9BACL|nr:hypothetical protein [Paenibacillus solanacearum]CAG7638440.1 hypothetical protein PAESOLCIP111_03941 [Paenibacillus solanacearum]
MLHMFNDVITFPPMKQGRTLVKTYNTYPNAIKQVSASLAGIDYGFSEEQGMFFRSETEVSSTVLTPYQFQISVTFGFRSRQFDKPTDAHIKYNVIAEFR